MYVCMYVCTYTYVLVCAKEPGFFVFSGGQLGAPKMQLRRWPWRVALPNWRMLVGISNTIAYWGLGGCMGTYLIRGL